MPPRDVCFCWPFRRNDRASEPDWSEGQDASSKRQRATPAADAMLNTGKDAPETSATSMEMETQATCATGPDEPQNRLPPHLHETYVLTSSPISESTRQRLWERAYNSFKEKEPEIVTAYEKILSYQLQEGDFHLSSLKSQENEIEQDADKRYSQMKKLIHIGLKRREKEAKIEKGVGDVMRIINPVKEMVDKVAKSEPHTAIAWVGACFIFEILQNTMNEHAARREGLVHVVSRIEWYSELSDLLLDENKAEQSSAGLRQKLEGHITSLFEKFIAYQMKSVCSYYRNPAVVWLRDLVQLDDWEGNIEDIKEAEVAVERDSNQYNKQEIKSHLQSLTDTGKNIKETLQATELLNQRQVELLEDIMDLKSKDCLKDLYVTDPLDDKQRIQSDKGGLLQDVYRWIWSNRIFKSWLQDDIFLLRISGDPGKGKTMLLCGIIDKLEKMFPFDTNLSYFFCQANDTRINNADAVLRGLIHKLVFKQPSLVSHVRKRYDTAGKKLFYGPNAYGTLSGILRDILHDPDLNPTYLIIDALDECSTGLEGLLKLIAELGSPRAKWIVSSRDWVKIEDGLNETKEEARLHLDLNEDLPPEAVTSYIEHKVNQLAKKKQYAPDLRDEVYRYMVDNAEGTFLWGALVCQELEKIIKGKTRGRLRSFPPGLDSIYQRMLEQIRDSEDEDLCKKILATISVVYRPVTLGELKELVQPPEDYDRSDLENIVRSCGSFLNSQDTVSFVHKSARDYLVGEANQILPFDISHQHKKIFERSLQLLQKTLKRDIYGIRQPGISIDEIKIEEIQDDPLAFVRYSCVHWLNHYCDMYEKNQDTPEVDAVSQFIQRFFLYWLEALSLAGHMGDGVIAVTRLRDLLKERSSDQELVGLVQDVYRFIWQNKWVIENHPLQTYASALIFCPAESIKDLFAHEEPKWIEIKPVIEKTWSSCQQTLEGHGNRVSSVAFSGSGKLMASGSYDKTIKIWDVATGALLRTLEGHGNWVSSVAFSRDGKLVVSGCRDKTIKIWDVETGALRWTFEGHGDGTAESVIYSADGQLAAFSSGDSGIEIRDMATGDLQQTLKGHSDEVSSVAFSGDGKIMASGSEGSTVKIWDMATGDLQQTLKGHSDAVSSVAFSGDGKLMASGSEDSTVKIWDVATGDLHRTLEGHSGGVSSVAFSGDGQLIGSGSYDKTIKIWDVATGVLQRTLKGHDNMVRFVAFLGGDKLVVSRDYGATVKIWDVATGALQRTLEESGSVSSVALGDGKAVASGSNNKTIKIWDMAAGDLQQTLKGHSDAFFSLAFSGDGKLMASGSEDSTVKIWDVATGDLHRTLEGHSSWVSSVAFSGDGQLIGSGSYDKTIKIWDVATGVLQRTLKGHDNMVRFVAFLGGDKLVVSRDYGATVKIWDVATGALQRTLEGSGSVSSVALSGDGKLLASAFSWDARHVISNSWDRTIKIWDVATGALQRVLKSSGHVSSVAFSRDDNVVASGSNDCTINIWDLATGTLMQTLEGRGSVLFVEFLGDGELVASSYFGGLVQIWDVATGTLWRTLGGKHYSVAFSRDGQFMASLSNDRTVKMWDVAKGNLQQTLRGYIHGGPMALSEEGKLALASKKTIEIWDAAMGGPQWTLAKHSANVIYVAFSWDGRLVASGSSDRTVKIWDAATGALRQTLEGHCSSVGFVAFSRDGQLVASCDERTIMIWDVATGDLRQTLEGQRDGRQVLLRVAFSRDGKLVASGSGDQTVRIWDVATGDLQQTLKGHSDAVFSVAFLTDGKLVASGSGDGTIKIWDVATGGLQRTLEVGGCSGHFSFSEDGQLVASCENRTVKIWDAVTGALRQAHVATGALKHEVEIFVGLVDTVAVSVAFSADSKLVATGSSDNIIKIWDTTTGTLQQTLEGDSDWVQPMNFLHSGTYLDETERCSYGLTLDRSWITWNGQKLLWLPSDCRCDSSAISSLIPPPMPSTVKVALGMRSGRFIIIGFTGSGPHEYVEP